MGKEWWSGSSLQWKLYIKLCPSLFPSPLGLAHLHLLLTSTSFAVSSSTWRMRFQKFKPLPRCWQSYTRKDSPPMASTVSMCPLIKVPSHSILPGIIPGRNRTIIQWNSSCTPKRNPKVLMRRCRNSARVFGQGHPACFDLWKLEAARYSLDSFTVIFGQVTYHGIFTQTRQSSTMQLLSMLITNLSLTLSGRECALEMLA